MISGETTVPRKYSMERRSAIVDETRQRIIDATMALHDEKGILATSMQDIAARAGVALGTVYRHFPSLDDLVPACGGRKLELYPPPTPDAFAGLDGKPRVQALYSALYSHYDAMERPYFVGYGEAAKLPVLRRFMDQVDAHVRSLVAEALMPFAASEEDMGLAVALADFHTWYAFDRAGFTSPAAAGIVADTVTAHLTRERSSA
jgi:AcrR family transcriptional regulator